MPCLLHCLFACLLIGLSCVAHRAVTHRLCPGPARLASGCTYRGPDCECQHLCGPWDTRFTLHPRTGQSPRRHRQQWVPARASKPRSPSHHRQRVQAAPRPPTRPGGWRAGGGRGPGVGPLGGLWAQSRASYQPRRLAASAGRGHSAGAGRAQGVVPGLREALGPGRGDRARGPPRLSLSPILNAVPVFAGSGVHPAQTGWWP